MSCSIAKLPKVQWYQDKLRNQNCMSIILYDTKLIWYVWYKTNFPDGYGENAHYGFKVKP